MHNSSPIELYGISWEFLAPYFIIDKKLGYLWKIKLNLKEISLAFSYDQIRLVQFLLRRAKSKPLLLETLKMIIENRTSLSILSKVFDILSDVLVKDSKEYFFFIFYFFFFFFFFIFIFFFLNLFFFFIF